MTRSGFIALAGRPNVGKSTLVNAIVGEKVAIVSDKPQTTRRAIRGVAVRGDTQLVLVDLPGVQRPRDALTQRMQSRVERELGDADAALLLLNAEHRGKEGPTDVLSFPIDGAEAGVPHGVRELGDIVICPEHTSDLREAIVHGALHLVGMDHETDDGEMLALQAEILSW